MRLGTLCILLKALILSAVCGAEMDRSKKLGATIPTGVRIRFTERERDEGKAAAMPSPPGILLDLVIEDGAVKKLQDAPREPVACMVRYVQAGKSIQVKAQVHLKGSKGSYQSVLERPSLTVEFPVESPFYGLRKVHLNNSVEDPGYWNERLGAELFSQAGVPAARSGHAAVVLNGKSLGLYVIKEGFEWELFDRFFQDPAGVVYEPKLGASRWWEDMAGRELTVVGDQAGQNPRKLRSGVPSLQVLAEDVESRPMSNRWTRVARDLDLESWCAFLALEKLIAHRDGYSYAHNNFKIYWHDAGKRWWFLPHGMDQVLGGIQIPLDATMSGPLAVAFSEMPDGELMVRARLKAFLIELFPLNTVERWVRRWESELAPSLSAANRRMVSEGAGEIIGRLRKRWKFLEEDLKRMPVPLLRFESGAGEQWVSGWERSVAEGVDASGLRVMSDSSPMNSRWVIEAGKEKTAYWRTQIRLAKGRYRIQTRMELKDWMRLDYGKFQGARMRVEDSGGMSLAQTEMVLKTPAGGKWVGLEFEVTQEEPVLVTLIWEARGQGGVATMLGAPQIARVR